MKPIDLNNIRSLCENHRLSLLVVFGSAADGSEHAHSDIDLAVLSEHPEVRVDKLKLIMDLQLLYDRQVDLVVLTPGTDPLLLHEIYTNCRVLYEARPDLCMEQYIRALRLYWDTAPLRRMERERLEAYVEGIEK